MSITLCFKTIRPFSSFLLVPKSMFVSWDNKQRSWQTKDRSPVAAAWGREGRSTDFTKA